MVTCEKCDGDGIVIVWDDEETYSQWHSCSDCDGEGEVEAGEAP